MGGSYFPEDKDLAHKIMMQLSNSDLVKICATNKRMYEVCNNYPSFWRNKFVKDYGEHAAQYKPKDRSWKDHYMTVFIDLEKFKKAPWQFFNYIAWKENVDDSLFIDWEHRTYTSLKNAPEWVTNNLYMLKLDIRMFKKRGGEFLTYKDITPIQFFLQQPVVDGYYINGLENLYGATTYPDSTLYALYTSTSFNKWGLFSFIK